jgi:hypothetical protein
MHDGQRFRIRVSSAAGAFLERWNGTARAFDQPTDVALRIAAQRPSGTVIEITVDGGVFRYRVGRMAGLPSVTRIKKTDVKVGA